MRERQQVVSLAAMREPSLLRFYVSREWLNKFNTFAEPGPITNHTFLCSHGGEGARLPRRWWGAGWGSRAEPPAPAPCAFLRRHPAQQIPLHRRPGGDPAPKRLGASVQQVRSQEARLVPSRPGIQRGGRGTAALPPRRPHQAAEGPGSSCRDPLAAVSAWKEMHTFVDPPSHRGQKTGSGQNRLSQRVGH